MGESIDELFSGPVPKDAVIRDPEGWYQTDPNDHAPTVTGERNKWDRRLIHYYARGTQGGAETYIKFDISPDKKFSREYVNGQPTGQDCDGLDGRKLKYDGASNRYSKIVLAYTAAIGQPPSNDKDLIQYLQTHPIRVKLFYSKDPHSKVKDLQVSDIEAPRR